MNRKISLTEIRLGQVEQEAVAEVLKSGYLREGERARRFEDAFKVRTGVKHAIAASSGTAALHLTNLVLLNPGDEVLVPAFTFVATASMVVMAGGKPVFCDIDPETWTLDPQDAARKITSKTKAIVGVHLFGNACDISDLQNLAKKHSLKLIWDAAQSLGTQYQHKDVACFEHAACFSFYPGKNMTTGEGGLVTTNDDAIARKIRLLKSHGESEKYVHEIVGLNYRMTEMQAALGLVQLNQLDFFLKERKRVAEKYSLFFQKNPLFQVQKITKDCISSYNYFSVLLKTEDAGISRDEWIQSLQGEGIPCAIHYPRPLHHQPCFSSSKSPALLHSEYLAERIFSLPMHPFLTSEDVDYILTKIEKAARKFSPSRR